MREGAAWRQRHEGRRSEVQIDRKNGHAQRAERHKTDLDLATRKALAGERADADADREHRQQAVTTASLPPRLRVNGVKLVRKTEPKNQSQEIPMIELKTAASRFAMRRLRQVSLKGFQLIARSGSAAGECGTYWAANRPATATTRTATAVAAAARSPNPVTSAPPPMVPSRIATKVPISTRPLPPVSSCPSRCCGKYEYLTGSEHRRLQAKQEDGGIQKPGQVPDQPDGSNRHDGNLGFLDAPDQPGLFEFVGELAAGCRKENEGGDEQGSDQESGNLGFDAAPLCRGIGRQQREGKLEDVVIEGAQEL